MFWFSLLLTIMAFVFAKQEYEADRIGWAMFWAMLIGWDLHSLLLYL